MNTILAKLLILVYGLSITGYVLLDSMHETLHAIKSELHHHEIKHTPDHNHQHHVEDHQDVFTPQDESSTEAKSTVKIFSLLLFYHSPINYIIPPISTTLKGNGLLKKLLTLTKAPLTPPPLR